MGRQISGVECALELGYCETSPRGMATALYRGKSFHWSCQIYPACQGILCVTEKAAYSLVTHLAPPAIWWQNNIYIYIGIKNDLNAPDAASKCSCHFPRERHLTLTVPIHTGLWGRGHLQTDRENFQTESQYFMLLHMHVTKTGTGSDIYLSLFRSQT